MAPVSKLFLACMGLLSNYTSCEILVLSCILSCILFTGMAVATLLFNAMYLTMVLVATHGTAMEEGEGEEVGADGTVEGETGEEDGDPKT